MKESLRTLAESRSDLPVLLAIRSAELMRLAARLLFHPCRNVLTTDLDWPSYNDILLAECQRSHRTMSRVAVRDALLRQHLREDELVAHVRDEFVRRGCDGLYLTAVSNLGLRLPVDRIVRAVEAVAEVWFIVIDGAQDFCHVSADLRNEYCDLYLAGSHKWLSACHPMGLGFYGRQRVRSFVETVLSHLVQTGKLDDPLLRFSSQLEATAGLDGRSETVNLASLFSCQGAVADALAIPGGPTALLPTRREDLTIAAELAAESGWQPLLPSPSLQTGILLLEAERAATKRISAEDMRSAFYKGASRSRPMETGKFAFPCLRPRGNRAKPNTCAVPFEGFRESSMRERRT